MLGPAVLCSRAAYRRMNHSASLKLRIFWLIHPSAWKVGVLGSSLAPVRHKGRGAPGAELLSVCLRFGRRPLRSETPAYLILR